MCCKDIKSPLFTAQVSVLFPKLKEVLMDDGMGEDELDAFISDIQTVENGFLKKVKFAKYPGVRPEERFWNLLSSWYSLAISYNIFVVLPIEQVNV